MAPNNTNTYAQAARVLRSNALAPSQAAPDSAAPTTRRAEKNQEKACPSSQALEEPFPPLRRSTRVIESGAPLKPETNQKAKRVAEKAEVKKDRNAVVRVVPAPPSTTAPSAPPATTAAARRATKNTKPARTPVVATTSKQAEAAPFAPRKQLRRIKLATRPAPSPVDVATSAVAAKAAPSAPKNRRPRAVTATIPPSPAAIEAAPPAPAPARQVAINNNLAAPVIPSAAVTTLRAVKTEENEAPAAAEKQAEQGAAKNVPAVPNRVPKREVKQEEGQGGAKQRLPKKGGQASKGLAKGKKKQPAPPAADEDDYAWHRPMPWPKEEEQEDDSNKRVLPMSTLLLLPIPAVPRPAVKEEPVEEDQNIRLPLPPAVAIPLEASAPSEETAKEKEDPIASGSLVKSAAAVAPTANADTSEESSRAPTRRFTRAALMEKEKENEKEKEKEKENETLVKVAPPAVADSTQSSGAPIRRLTCALAEREEAEKGNEKEKEDLTSAAPPASAATQLAPAAAPTLPRVDDPAPKEANKKELEGEKEERSRRAPKRTAKATAFFENLERKKGKKGRKAASEATFPVTPTIVEAAATDVASSTEKAAIVEASAVAPPPSSTLTAVTTAESMAISVPSPPSTSDPTEEVHEEPSNEASTAALPSPPPSPGPLPLPPLPIKSNISESVTMSKKDRLLPSPTPLPSLTCNTAADATKQTAADRAKVAEDLAAFRRHWDEKEEMNRRALEEKEANEAKKASIPPLPLVSSSAKRKRIPEESVPSSKKFLPVPEPTEEPGPLFGRYELLPSKLPYIEPVSTCFPSAYQSTKPVRPLSGLTMREEQDKEERERAMRKEERENAAKRHRIEFEKRKAATSEEQIKKLLSRMTRLEEEKAEEKKEAEMRMANLVKSQQILEERIKELEKAKEGKKDDEQASVRTPLRLLQPLQKRKRHLSPDSKRDDKKISTEIGVRNLIAELPMKEDKK